MFEANEDISPVSLWRSTMMANSAKDPLWMAKAAIELTVFPQHAELINDRCTVCHAAAGFTEAFHEGAEHYSIAESQNDALARDGVSCTVCHQIQGTNLGQNVSFSGGYEIEAGRIVFGPYTEPLTAPMFNMSGYLPEQADHIHQAALCATCHTLFTPSLNHEGEVIGSFPEQTPFIEWLNSSYPASGTTCQECHMPTATGAQDIALLPPWHTNERSPFWNHEFAGGNDFMLRMFRDHQTELGVTASFLQFEDTRSRSTEMLQSGVELEIGEWAFIDDSLSVEVHVRNRAGHKFPSGIPLRRLWLHVTVYNESMQVIFESGDWDEAGEIIGLDEGFEPHHNVIRSGDEVQIYEGIMADVDGTQTYTLLKAVNYLKDNRLPPEGFVSTVSYYDTITIEGLATNDLDFNRDGSIEGTGGDIVHYRLPVAAYNVEVQACYQSVTPRLIEYFEEYDLPETNSYVNLYYSIANEPIIVAEAFLPIETSAKPIPGTPMPRSFELLPAFPNPFNSETSLSVQMLRSGNIQLVIYNELGQEVLQEMYSVNAGLHRMKVQAQDWASGNYYATVSLKQEKQTTRMTLIK